MKMRQSFLVNGLLLAAGMSLVSCGNKTSQEFSSNSITNIDKGSWRPYEQDDSGSDETSDEICKGYIGEVFEVPDPTVPPVIPIPPQFKLSQSSSVSSSSDPIDLIGSALNSPVVADNVGMMGVGSYNHVDVTANTIAEVGSMSANTVLIRSNTIGTIRSLSVGNMSVLAHTIDHAGSFSGTFCAAIKKLKNLHSLSSKLTVYGSYEGDTRASIDSISSMSAFVSFHDVDIGSIHSGSFKGRIENSIVGSVTSSSGEIYLVNSRIEKISGFSGKIHLLGGSSIGTVENSSLQIIQ